jgi:hypothetical protein
VGHRPTSYEVGGDGRVTVELAGAEGGSDDLHRLGSGAKGGGGGGVPVAQWCRSRVLMARSSK